ncbi:hypothetical protein [Burkholderia thailandensis]|uniref:hypothetical protein n=1 Tax=Burkholderia thailandensis TaxID=57975 RepID=UPI00217E6562|nr:hypothetical protein [Burkholderia thailandensis]MCS6428069.1 hypothetical protein [Burkholderia thailandensis]MCS6467231.1 hypothetical protein [Burkholderia thailandensis]
MQERVYLEAVPAYHATAPDGRTVPFIVSLLLHDADNKPRITPAVERSIDRTIDITGREGLALAIIAADDEMPATARRYIERAMGIPGAIVLFRCQSPETAEHLMQHLHAEYQLTLVQEPAEPSRDKEGSV